MRNLLFFLLLVPSAFAGSKAPDCTELKGILSDLETSLHDARIPPKECSSINPGLLEIGNPQPGFPSQDQKDFLEAYRCKDNASIDLQMKNIENEIALLRGIDSLHLEIQNGTNQVKTLKNPEAIKEAGRNLIQNISIAQSLELFLGTNNDKNDNIFSELSRTDIKQWSTLQSFGKFISNYCEKYKIQNVGVCSQGFTITEETYREIKDFVTIGGNTDRKFNKRQVKDLIEALSLEKDGQPYTYSQLMKDLNGIGDEGILTSEGLTTLKNMPEFSKSDKFDFLKKLRESKNALTAQSTASRFGFFLKDLKKRQEWEMKNKLSVVLHRYQNKIGDEADQICRNANTSPIDAANCLEKIKATADLDANQKESLSGLIVEFKYGGNQLTKLNELITDCVVADDGSMPEKCHAQLPQALTALQERKMILEALQQKILADKAGNITLRNYAVEKYQELKCASFEDISYIECNSDLGAISREAILLSSDMYEIAYTFAKPAQATDISNLCKGKMSGIPKIERLCDFGKESVSISVPKDDYKSAGLSPDNARDPATQAIVSSIGNLLNGFAQTMSPQYYGPNPYPIYPMQTYGSTPTMSISDQILAPSMNRGYGYYSPTPGVVPYSSIASGTHVLAPYSTGSSKFFNSPTGWGDV